MIEHFALRATCLATIAWFNLACSFTLLASDRVPTSDHESPVVATPFSVTDIQGRKLELTKAVSYTHLTLPTIYSV